MTIYRKCSSAQPNDEPFRHNPCQHQQDFGVNAGVPPFIFLGVEEIGTKVLEVSEGQILTGRPSGH